MKLTLTDEGVYIPKFNANRNLPEPEQVRVKYRLVSTKEYAQLVHWSQPDMVFDEDGKVKESRTTLRLVRDDPGFLKASILEIENLDVEVDGKPTTVKTAEDLLAAKSKTLRRLYDELIVFFMAENAEDPTPAEG